MSKKILIVDDDESLRWVLQRAFEKKGYEVASASSGKEGLGLIKKDNCCLAVVDINMPDMSGLELLEKVKEGKFDTHVIIMTAQNTMKNAVEAMKLGAYDYVTKPFDIEEILIITEKALEAIKLSKELSSLKNLVKERYEVGTNIIGKSQVMQKVYKTIGKVAANDVTVLIEGESGTGKELIARSIHYNSDRSGAPFIAVNSAAIPKELLESELFGHERGAFTGATERRVGKFELAQGGTLFLDEIGDMGIDLQLKLLRALQEKEIDRVGGKEPIRVDVRVLAATNRDLVKAVKEKSFREDLYYRLNVIRIKLPPLRERSEDIPLLVDYFLDRFTEELPEGRKDISPETMKILRCFDWPGNVRELENCLRRAAILSTSTTILPADLPSRVREASKSGVGNYDDVSLEEIMNAKLTPLIKAVDEDNTEGLYSMVLTQMERPLLRLVLEKCRWNQIKAAKVLGLNRNTLKKKMDLLGIKKESGK